MKKGINTHIKVSVIVPVYNVEKYLVYCIESILCQSFREFELVLIDDGSRDRSGLICDQYAEADSRIIVIHKENGGLSDARNTGIAIARGEYITFIDSDDIVAQGYLKEMLDVVRKTGADIVQCENSRNQGELECWVGKEKIEVLKSQDILHEFFRVHKPNVLACGKLYRTCLFENVRFPFGLIDEDNFTTYKTFYRAKIFVAINCVLYYYRVNSASITQKEFSKERLGIYNCVGEIRNYLKNERELYDCDLNYYQMRLGVQLFNQVVKAKKDKEFGLEMENIRKYLASLSCKEIGEEPKYTIMRFMIVHKIPLYKKIIRLFKKTS